MLLNAAITGLLLIGLEIGSLWRIRSRLFLEECFVSKANATLVERLRKSLVKLIKLPVGCGLALALLVIADAIPQLNLYPKVQILAVRFNNSVINTGFYIVGPILFFISSWSIIYDEIKGPRKPIINLIKTYYPKIALALLALVVLLICEPRVELKSSEEFKGSKDTIVDVAVFTTRVALMITSSACGAAVVYDTWNLISPEFFNDFLNDLNVDELSNQSFGKETDYAIRRASNIKKKKKEDWQATWTRRALGAFGGVYGFHLVIMSSKNVLTHGGMSPADVGSSVIGLISPLAIRILPVWPVELVCQFVEQIAWVFSLILAINTALGNVSLSNSLHEKMIIKLHIIGENGGWFPTEISAVEELMSVLHASFLSLFALGTSLLLRIYVVPSKRIVTEQAFYSINFDSFHILYDYYFAFGALSVLAILVWKRRGGLSKKDYTILTMATKKIKAD